MYITFSLNLLVYQYHVLDYNVGIPLVKPVGSKQQRPVTPPAQHVPEPKIEIIPPTSPTRVLDSNPFRTAPTASPALPRRSSTDNGATATLDVQTTLSKAKSLVSLYSIMYHY